MSKYVQGDKMNNRTAKLLIQKELYPNGANSPTLYYEYECPCKKGKIIEENVIGFHDYYAFIKCKNCQTKYSIITGQGYRWKLEEK